MTEISSQHPVPDSAVQTAPSEYDTYIRLHEYTVILQQESFCQYKIIWSCFEPCYAYALWRDYSPQQLHVASTRYCSQFHSCHSSYPHTFYMFMYEPHFPLYGMPHLAIRPQYTNYIMFVVTSMRYIQNYVHCLCRASAWGYCLSPEGDNRAS